MKTTITKVAPKKVAKVAPKKVTAKVTAKVTGRTSVSLPVKKVKSAKTTTKTTTKKISSASGKKGLVEASSHNSFWMNDGQILNTLVALAGALNGMETVVYKYHTNNGRHDFANWVDDVLSDADCATALRKCKTAKTAHAVLVTHLKSYSY